MHVYTIRMHNSAQVDLYPRLITSEWVVASFRGRSRLQFLIAIKNWRRERPGNEAKWVACACVCMCEATVQSVLVP